MNDILITILQNGPATVAELQEKLGKSETTVRKALKALTDEGKVEKDGTSFKLTDVVPARKRGRPKDVAVQLRDEKVLELITDAGETGLTIASLAETLEVKPTVAYISVWRLKKDAKIEKVATGTRQPAYRAAS